MTLPEVMFLPHNPRTLTVDTTLRNLHPGLLNLPQQGRPGSVPMPQGPNTSPVRKTAAPSQSTNIVKSFTTATYHEACVYHWLQTAQHGSALALPPRKSHPHSRPGHRDVNKAACRHKPCPPSRFPSPGPVRSSGEEKSAATGVPGGW